MLKAFREVTTPADRETYARLVGPHIPEGASLMDWRYTHTPNKLYSVIYAHLNVDPIKIVDGVIPEVRV